MVVGTVGWTCRFLALLKRVDKVDQFKRKKTYFARFNGDISILQMVYHKMGPRLKVLSSEMDPAKNWFIR
jgi:hypothetical protein